MAEVKYNDCNAVPTTRETGQFNFPVWFSEAEVPWSMSIVNTRVIAGCKLDAVLMRCDSVREFRLTLVVRHGANRSMEGVKVIPSMVLVDKTGSPSSTGTGAIGSFLEDTIVYSLRARAEDVKANCVVNHNLQVRCSVEVIRDGTRAPPPLTEEEEVLPDLGHDLIVMWDKKELTDVCFDVDGESFSAHRLVLAARSPVFRAQLYGPMAESKMTSITIQEMAASTFRSMLHYMYYGSLPNASKADVSFIMGEYQRLLVAADRYGLERLKNICEDKLCGNGITIDNVVSFLELADGHICPKLKAMCLDFLSDGENFKMVATTDEYFHLMQTVPSILVEVRNRFKMAHEKLTITDPGANKKTRMV